MTLGEVFHIVLVDPSSIHSSSITFKRNSNAIIVI
jgi:hypothetical protein